MQNSFFTINPIMNKQLLNVCLRAVFCASISLAHGQEFHVKPGGQVFIASSGVLHAESGTFVTGTGIITNNGTLSLKNTITGSDKVVLEEPCTLVLLKDTEYEFSNQTDEKCTNLTIGDQTALATVPSGGSLTITGAYNNTRTGTPGLVLKAGSAQGSYAQFLPSGTVTNAGITQAEQYLTSATTATWRQLSSPVDATLAQLEDDFEMFYRTGAPTGTAQQVNAWWYDASPYTNVSQNGGEAPGPLSNSNANYWTPADAGTEAFNHTRAYNVFSGAPFTIDNSGVLDLSGTFYNANQTYTLYKTHDFGYAPPTATYLSISPFDGGTTDPNLITGWNLIPNPYTTNIDISVLLGDAGFAPSYKAVHVWDAPNQRYIAITDGLNTVVEWNNDEANANTSANNIAPFQAFWVKADLEAGTGSPSATQNLELKTSFRTVTKNASFFKTTPAHVRLLVSNGDSTKKDASIVAFDDAHNNNLNDEDARHLASANREMANLYTLAGGIPTSINRLAIPAPGHAVPLHVNAPQNGESFAISLQDFETPLSWTYHIYDWHTKKLHDLKNEGPFTFKNDNSFSGTNRFTFYVNYKDAGYDATSGIKIWSNTEGILVSFAHTNDPTAKVQITDALGRVLFKGTVPTTKTFVWPVASGHPSLYVVSATTASANQSEKIVR